MLKKVNDADDFDTYFALSRPEMLKYIPKNSKRILEVGCGTGHFAKGVKNILNCEYWGIEPFPDAAGNSQNIIDKVINTNFDNAYPTLPVNYFDCIIFNDVLEHLVNPFDTLDKLYNILPSGASVITSIPNVRYAANLKKLLVDRDWEYLHEGGILDFTHLRFFTKKSIIRMFEQSNFKIKSIEGINKMPAHIFLPFNILTLGYFNDTQYLQFATIAVKE
jgi:2-polyprenyl-3-methyl-5-hydroxy-6-metoxy-1,4-benzoquinol methylase